MAVSNNSHGSSNQVPGGNHNQNPGGEHGELQALQTILYGFSFVIVGLFSRQFSTIIRFPVSHHILMVLVGLVVGELSYLHKRLEDPMMINQIGQLRLLQLYLPLLFFDLTFNLEVHYMKVMIFHLLLVVIPTLLLASIASLAFHGLLTLHLNPLECVIMMTLTLPSGPRMTRLFLSSMSAEYDLRMPLEAESLFGSCVTYVFYTAVTSRMFQDSILFAFPFLVDILVGATFGFIIGKIMIYWISHMFKDTVNQTTIVIAFIYLAFAFCQLQNVSGFLCVVVIGLVMADRRAVMSTQTTTVLNKFMELILFMFSCVATVQVGIYLANRIWKTLTGDVVMVSIATFLLGSFIRAFVLMVTYPISRLYLNSTNLLYILCVCHLRDSYTCIIAFTLIDTRLQKHVNDELFSIAMLHIIFSFIVNYALAMTVVNIVQTRAMSNDKAIMLERAARMIIDLQASVTRSLKSNMLTTDADWSTVMDHTRLKDDFLKLYKNRAWLQKKRDLINQFLDTQALRKQAVRQIVINERTSYVRQFEEGVLSRQSVINLMIHVNEALKQKQLVDPYQIVQYAGYRNSANKLVLDMMHMITINNWHICPRILVCMLIITDAAIVVYTICVIRFQPLDYLKQLLLHIYSFVVFLIYVIIELYKMAVNKRRGSVGPWDIANRLIIFISLVDLTGTCLPLYLLVETTQHVEILTENQTYFMLIQLFTFSRLLRLVQLIRVSPYLQQCLVSFISHIMERKVFIACDMAAGFIQGTMETYRKANHIVEDSHVSASIRYVCHLCRLLLAQHLGLCQVDNPLVMQALKTKTAIRLTLNAQEQRLTEIKEMGLLGERDIGIIQKVVEKRMIDNRSFPTSIGELGHKSVILHLPWIDGNERYAQFIEDNGQSILFSPDDIIVTQGHIPGGIFVILNGLVRVESVIDQSEYIIEPQIEKIRAPYYAKDDSTFQKKSNRELVELIEFYTRGNVIGETSLLTGKPGHKTYRCATYVEAFFISHAHIIEMMEGEPDNKRPMKDLEMRMWRTVSIRQAVRLILSEISSGSLTRKLIYNRMSDSYIIDGNMNRVIDIRPHEVSAVILVQGVVKNFYSDARFIGPCIIPFYIQRILSEPEKGPRVIFLCLKTSVTDEGTLMENLMQDELFPDEDLLSDIDDDQMTVSSGSSDGRPYHRPKKSVAGQADKSAAVRRMEQYSANARTAASKVALKPSTGI